jgi:hypothetical protein
LGGGRRLHNVQFFIFSNTTEDPSPRFAMFSLKVFSQFRPALFSFLSRTCRRVLGSIPAFLFQTSVSEAHILCAVPLRTVGHPSTGGGKFPLLSTIFPGSFLLLLGALRGLIADTPPFPQSFTWRNCVFSVGNFVVDRTESHEQHFYMQPGNSRRKRVWW